MAEATREVTQADESIIGKITMKTIGVKPNRVVGLPENETELPLARVYGKLNDVKYQEDKEKGQVYTYFTGTFEAINMETGEVFKSGKLFLPKGISEMVEDATKKARGGKDGAASDVAIAFAFEVRSMKATNPVGYSYKVLALKSPEASDELKELRDMIHKAGTIEPKRLTGSQTGKATTIDAHQTGKKAS